MVESAGARGELKRTSAGDSDCDNLNTSTSIKHHIDLVLLMDCLYDFIRDLAGAFASVDVMMY